MIINNKTGIMVEIRTASGAITAMRVFRSLRTNGQIQFDRNTLNQNEYQSKE